jgi:hypothetical protein
MMTAATTAAMTAAMTAATDDYRAQFAPKQMVLYSSYIGPVTLNLLYNEKTTECLMEGMIEMDQEKMNTKVIAAKEHGLDSEAQYASSQLIGLRSQIMHPSTNALVYSMILRVRLLLAPLRNTQMAETSQLTNFLARAPPVTDQAIKAWAEMNCTSAEQLLVQHVLRGDGKTPARVLNSAGPSLLNKLLNMNSSVDCLFHSQQYLLWLYEAFQQVGIGTPNKTLITINGLAMDNAYFTGEYMAIGTGLQMFNDMASPDVMAHECSHGLVQTLAGLEYQGESGANNESFADSFACAYEFYLDAKFNQDKDATNDILGAPDWLVGEDVGQTMPWLRNMSDPNNARTPQPKVYKGKFWYSGPEDNGGVHCNSGVMNYCFYRYTRYVGLTNAIKNWYLTLKSLQPTSTMHDVAATVLRITQGDANARDALIDANLLASTPTDGERRAPKNPAPTVPAPTPAPTHVPTPVPAPVPTPAPHTTSVSIFRLPLMSEEMVIVPLSLWEKVQRNA